MAKNGIRPEQLAVQVADASLSRNMGRLYFINVPWIRRSMMMLLPMWMTDALMMMPLRPALAEVSRPVQEPHID